MPEPAKKVFETVGQNLAYLDNTEHIFRDDFNKSIRVINTSYDCFIKALNSVDAAKDIKMFHQIKISLDNFAQSIIVYSTVFQEIIGKLVELQKSEDSDMSLINTRIGLEATLFTFSVSVVPVDYAPFFKSKYVEIYKCYNDLHKMNNNIAAIKSVCGTGKTLCIPIILLCRSLKDNMNIPFLLITQPSPKHVESKEHFFNNTISKYVTIVTDPDQLAEMYNNYEKTMKIDKMVLAVLTPHNLLPLMFQMRKNKQFYPKSRIIVDEIHQRSFHLDVLISKIAQFDTLFKPFQNPLSVILESATIPPSLLNPFKGRLNVTTLIKYPAFEIVERKPIIENNIQKINNKIMRNETVKVIQEMALVKSSIEEGHILCFLSGIGICYRLKNSVMSILRHNEETDQSRKIVILQTTLKPNETTESYFRRLREEYMLNEGLREGKKYKNEFLYIVPLVLSGLVDDAIYELAQNEFPGDLSKINKLICSTPMIESSFTIDRLSVVVDSGLFKETQFDVFTSLTTLTEKQTSKESMYQRKGRLGRTMKGLYVPIHGSNVPDVAVPPIQRLDLSTNILLMKDISIDFEKIDNFPDKPNHQNFEFAMNTLIDIKAIDSKTQKITPFGHELLNYPFISIYYAAAVINFRNSFPEPERPYANFIAAYVMTIVSMDSLLVQEYMTEKLSLMFKEDSDITTLVNTLNTLLKSEIDDNDQMRDLVESYGFSYTQFLVFKQHIQEIVDLTFKGKKIPEVINCLGKFVGKYHGITPLVDILIQQIGNVYPNWYDIHYIQFKYVSGAGGFESRPTLVFNGDRTLKFQGQKQYNSEIRISNRPGWNGIMIPTECYCFNISRNMNARINNGRLIHRVDPRSQGAIQSIECNKIALSPWFNVLVDTYFESKGINITKFSNRKNRGKNSYLEYRNFHFSNVGERVFVSFLSNDNSVKSLIQSGIEKCIKLMPYTPRSLVVFNKEFKSLIEITSIGASHYESSLKKEVNGGMLNSKMIDFCLSHLDELAKSNPKIRICAAFFDPDCKLKDYDQEHLYYINELSQDYSLYSSIDNMWCMHREKLQYEEMNSRTLSAESKNYIDSLEYFQFPTKFIHPALMYHQESLDCILEWFHKKCPYAKVLKVVGHRFLMYQSSIKALQIHLRLGKEQIKAEMNLKFVVTPIPSKVYSKVYLKLREHPTWDYNSRFKVLITTNDEKEQVDKMIEEAKNEIESEEKSEKGIDGTLCCCYVCEDPDNPVLTNYPITIYYEDGSTYTNKMCRECIVSTLQVATESYFANGKINENTVCNISIKPATISTVDSKESQDGLYCWPQVPLGQMISALINNDDELAELISAWLIGITNFTIRVMGADVFTFCPDHPKKLFTKDSKTLCLCKENNCGKSYCIYCNAWHLPSFICDETNRESTSNGLQNALIVKQLLSRTEVVITSLAFAVATGVINVEKVSKQQLNAILT